ncbi:MAG: hypothetical protein WC656_01650 [Sulfurimonas sp.]|jgi:hypothetical protein
MLKNTKISVLALVGVSMYFSGCATINSGIERSITYTAHSVTGIPYPMKSGKIYIESTTAKDTQHVTPLNAQLHGFDNVVATNIMQCDSLPELTEVFIEHGWIITKNKEEADYQLSTSVVYCGYAKDWLSKSNREQSMKERGYYRDFKLLSKQKDLNITDAQIENEEPEALAKLAEYFDVTKVNKNYFNVFDYKYKEAPENIKAMANANSMSAHFELKDPSHHSINAISTGAGMMQSNSTAGMAMMGVGLLFGMGHSLPEYSGYKSEIKVYNTQTKETKIEYIENIIPMNSLVEKVGRYENYKGQANYFARGLFYK